MPSATIERVSGAAAAIEDADIAVATRFARHRHHPAVRAAGAFSEIADQPPLFSLCAAVLGYGLLMRDRRATEAGARMLAAFLAATWIKGGVKRAVSRSRPNVLLEEGEYDVRVGGPDEGPWHSFPSGHTTGAVAVARAFSRAYAEGRVPAYAAAAAIAATQVPRGAHYPVDVLAGLVIGLAAEALVDRAAGMAGLGRAGGGRDRDRAAPRR